MDVQWLDKRTRETHCTLKGSPSKFDRTYSMPLAVYGLDVWQPRYAPYDTTFCTRGSSRNTQARSAIHSRPHAPRGGFPSRFDPFTNRAVMFKSGAAYPKSPLSQDINSISYDIQLQERRIQITQNTCSVIVFHFWKNLFGWAGVIFGRGSYSK